MVVDLSFLFGVAPFHTDTCEESGTIFFTLNYHTSERVEKGAIQTHRQTNKFTSSPSRKKKRKKRKKEEEGLSSP